MWIPYDHENRDANPLPTRGDLVWIYDEYYQGATIGYWDGWWSDSYGSDDVGVSHWMPLEYPKEP